MPRPVKLSAEQVSSALAPLVEWSLVEGRLHREYKFADFTLAFGFMAAVATIAEKMDHHPDWQNVYNRVSVNLMTHDAGGLTELDFRLAEKMDSVAARFR